MRARCSLKDRVAVLVGGGCNGRKVANAALSRKLGRVSLLISWGIVAARAAMKVDLQAGRGRVQGAALHGPMYQGRQRPTRPHEIAEQIYPSR